MLALCPTWKDKRELVQPHIQEQYDIIFHHYDDGIFERIHCLGIGWITEKFDPETVIKEVVDVCKQNQIEAILATKDYPESVFASIIAQKMGFIAPGPRAVLTCQHKYYARCRQKELVPEATPKFELADFKQKEQRMGLSYPFFIKPVKSFFSVYADCIPDHTALHNYLQTSQMPDEFLHQFNWFIKKYTDFQKDVCYALAEEYLTGAQVTLEGLMYDGTFLFLGIVDSIMFSGTICFQRFEYPSSLPEKVQKRMAAIARTVMTGIGFDNGAFNIEFMYNPEYDTVHIIEINSRMDSQAADLLEKVDGTNTYEHLLRLVTGQQPIIKKNQGIHNVAASFVLRTFKDAHVVSVPTAHDVARVKELFPDARIDILTRPGTKLSDTFQDGKSYRYGLIHLGGADRVDLFEKFEYVRKQLTFSFGD